MPKLIRTTPRLVIRPLGPSDYDAWREALSTMLPQRNPWDKKNRPMSELTRARFRQLLQKQEERRENDTFYDLGAFDRETGALVGWVSLMDIARSVFQNSYLGYSVFNRHWGKGFGKEAVKAAIDIAFKDLKLHRIEAGIEPRNRRSIGLARSIGFRPEGKKRKCLFLRGRWVDILMFSLTTEDVGMKFRGKRPQPEIRR